MKELVELLNNNSTKKYSADSLSHRLSRGSILYNEMVKIADTLGYKLEFTKK